MKIHFELSDPRHHELINELRGKRTADEFMRECAVAGLALAHAHRQQHISGAAASRVAPLSRARVDFRELTGDVIASALKTKDLENSIQSEVRRLVHDYASQLRMIAAGNGNRLPAKMHLSTNAEIEKIAF